MQGPYRFDAFVLDPGQRRLTRDGKPVEVSGRYFDALHLLVRDAPSLVTKDRFMAEIWAGAAVTDEALTQCIRSLRRALGDNAAAPAFVETVPRYGYRFVAAVEQTAPTMHTAHVVADGSASPWATVIACALGGAAAGLVGAIVYVTSGLVRPVIGASSTLIGLATICLLLGLIGGTAIGAGLALGRASSPGRILGAGLGGLVVGGLASVIGRDLFILLFGRAPDRFTGPLEGLALGLAVGVSVALLARRDRPSAWAPVLPVAVGTAAGLAIAASGGQLFSASLLALSQTFVESPLRFAPLTPTLLALSTAAEAAVFVTACSLCALAAARLTVSQPLLMPRS